MNNIVNISDFRNNISDYINRVIYNKDSFLLKRGGSIVAKVIVYKEKDKHFHKDVLKKYAGILSDSEANDMRVNMRNFRKSFQILDSRKI